MNLSKGKRRFLIVGAAIAALAFCLKRGIGMPGGAGQ